MGQKLIKEFGADIEKIKNHTFWWSVRDLCDDVPDYILEIPSSSTGKYHPRDEYCKRGMIKHIKKCLVLVEDAVNLFDFNQNEKDILIAACVLHDIFKSGIENSGHTIPEHPYLIYKFIQDNKDVIGPECLSKVKVDKINQEMIEQLSLVCLFHMGRWTPKIDEITEDLINKSNTLCHAFHLIDYYASRKSFYEIYSSKLTRFYHKIVNRGI